MTKALAEKYVNNLYLSVQTVGDAVYKGAALIKQILVRWVAHELATCESKKKIIQVLNCESQ